MWARSSRVDVLGGMCMLSLAHSFEWNVSTNEFVPPELWLFKALED